MRFVVVFESMFGATRQIAAAIAEGLEPHGEVTLANVNDPASALALDGADVLIAGGPTHVHGMSRPASRAEAQNWAKDPARQLTLEPSAPGIGVREWLDSLGRVPRFFAAFDTRIDVARIISGAASGGIDYRLTHQGSYSVAPNASFLVSKLGELEDGELERAREWGASVGEHVLSLPVRH